MLQRCNIGRIIASVIFGVSLVVFIGACSARTGSYDFIDPGNGTASTIRTNGTALGRPDAPVTIEEYGDFQCPFCKRFADDVQPKIVSTYVVNGKVRLVFHAMGNWVSRNAPGNEESELSAEAAYFAADHNRFWQYHDRLYAIQDKPNSGTFSLDRLVLEAKSAGLNAARMRAALLGHDYSRRITADRESGTERGVTSTPTFFVNGERIVGAQPFAAFQAAIEKALAE